jgi:hypothetical protein
LRIGIFIVHLTIIAYVTLGWMIHSREALFIYTLLLPVIVIQWLLNGGASIVNNIENLLRSAQWNDPGNLFEGALFKTMLGAVGVRASQIQITTILCLVMLIFWVTALHHMVMIVPLPA